MNGRKIREPLMFTDEEKFHSLLDREQYEFVLDRACVQYEPDEPSYQQVTSTTYQHVDALKKYDMLRYAFNHSNNDLLYIYWIPILPVSHWPDLRSSSHFLIPIKSGKHESFTQLVPRLFLIRI